MKTTIFSKGRSKVSRVVILLAVFALLVQACASNPATPDQNQAQPVAKQAPATGVPPESIQPAALRIAVQPIVQTDPAFISSDPEILVANHVYDYLVDVGVDNSFAPRLAKD